jgi:DNA-binding transcriptional ArsR family regulator
MPATALRVVASSDEPFSPHALALAPEDWSGVPDALIPARKVDTSGPADRARAAKREARFIKGPLPIEWLAAATRAGHPLALPVLLALKHKADTLRQEWVKPPASVLRLFGVDKDGRSRAIAALERAGLVEVRRRKGRPPLVRLRPWRAGEAEGSEADG